MTNQFRKNSKLSILYTVLRKEEKTVPELMAILRLTENALRRFKKKKKNIGINVEMSHAVVGKVIGSQYPQCSRLMSFKIV